MKRFITYGEERIGFSIRLSARASRRVAIHVEADGTVTVDAPADTPVADVVAAVRSRVRWIWLRLRAVRERGRHVLPRQYVSGESHFYLGKRYVLKVIVGSAQRESVKLLGGRLEVRMSRRDPARVRALLDAWYRERADDVFARRIAACAAKTPWLKTPWLKTPPGFRKLTMRTQWGSCSPKGDLQLNPLLVKAPGPCIDYVIFHELCHLKEHNHSARFYRLLGGLLPDWRRWKTELDDLADQLLNR